MVQIGCEDFSPNVSPCFWRPQRSGPSDRQWWPRDHPWTLDYSPWFAETGGTWGKEGPKQRGTRDANSCNFRYGTWGNKTQDGTRHSCRPVRRTTRLTVSRGRRAGREGDKTSAIYAVTSSLPPKNVKVHGPCSYSKPFLWTTSYTLPGPKQERREGRHEWPTSLPKPKQSNENRRPGKKETADKSSPFYI